MVHAPFGHVNDDLLNRLVVVIRVDTIGRPKLTSQGKLIRIGINGNDTPCIGLFCPLNDCKPNTAQAKYRHAIACLYLGGIMHRPNASRYTTAQQAHFLWVGLWVNLGKRHFSNHGIFTKGRTAHIMINRLALIRKTGRAVWHESFALGFTHRHA